MKNILRCLPYITTMMACLMPHANASDIPFEKYPAASFTAKQPRILYFDDNSKKFRSRLRLQARQHVNFGGHYIFGSWGAANSCVTGAIIDVITGDARIFPYPICQTADENQPFLYDPSSRLLAAVGRLGENGPDGMYFFEIKGTEFEPLPQALQEQIFKSLMLSGSVSPSGGPESSPGNNGTKDPITAVAAIRNDPSMGPIVGCYEAAYSKGINSLYDASKEEKDFILRTLLAGGYSRIGSDVVSACNRWYMANSEIPGDKERMSEAMGKIFMSYVMDQEKAFLGSCFAHDGDASWENIVKLCRKLAI